MGLINFITSSSVTRRYRALSGGRCGGGGSRFWLIFWRARFCWFTVFCLFGLATGAVW